jgi:predicted nucleic acid-binding protein
MIILDTDVISETLKLQPDVTYVRNMRELDIEQAFVTSISFAEMRAGVELLPTGEKRDLLDIRVNLVFERDFAGRMLDFSSAAAFEFGEIVGRVGPAVFEDMLMDAQIAAIARSKGASIATRNVKHFKLFEVPLINPWDA